MKLVAIDTFSTTTTKFRVSCKREEFLNNPRAQVLSLSLDPLESQKNASDSNKQQANRKGTIKYVEFSDDTKRGLHICISQVSNWKCFKN